MIKRTLHFGNPAYLSLKNQQLIVQIPDAPEGEPPRSVPIEDIGFVLLDHPQITITQGVLEALMENNAAIVTCDKKHHPSGLMLPLEGHTLQSARYQAQIAASEPLRKQLWQQTIAAKINNQAAVLEAHFIEAKPLRKWAKEVLSGDSTNLEARAAVYYWRHIFEVEYAANDDSSSSELDTDFVRRRDGDAPNSLLNYGYAILRAAVARGLVASGLLPTLGIHHRNQYNAFCLDDDIMEPYRPLVDKLVKNIFPLSPKDGELTPELKRKLLVIPTLDVVIDGKSSPLMVGLQRSTASLVACYEGTAKKILYPKM